MNLSDNAGGQVRDREEAAAEVRVPGAEEAGRGEARGGARGGGGTAAGAHVTNSFVYFRVFCVHVLDLLETL